ncbi:SpaH/EbpB family LPXTG-anchored major pilin [Bifidobacterium aerophilum]|uniref:SpaH/EbpB family LPXTG-anchored major pilin n=1 Tax=Bifidobacterium aerophilum TaxID=1798155 RepID=A0A6N9Z2A1_9BIFI|nr:SpaH/EbpB family LPXTG-anchored major pilin [Bifidobacterium aerophilum]NEG88662.1 SpaH/EbpB family LPXTG-anchored major pilin [Bifidobacterium aerophilum]
MNSLTKKLAAGAIAAATMLGIAGLGATTASADQAADGKLTVSTTDVNFASTDSKTVKVNAYRIFSATVGEDGTASYTFDATANGGWDQFFADKSISGLSENYTTAADAAKAISQLTDKSTPTIDAFAKKASNWAQTKKAGSSPAESNAKLIESKDMPKVATEGKYSVTFDNLTYGYYLVAVPGVGNTNASGKYATLAPVLNGTEVTADIKGTLPTVDKKVQTGTDEDNNPIYGDVKDSKVGDTLTFTLTSKVPDMSAYDTYEFAFKDTLSKGLTFGNISSITIADSSLTFTENTNYVQSLEEVKNDKQEVTGHKLVVNLGTKVTDSDPVKYDFKQIASDLVGKTITLTYTATINENAVVGSTGNTNSATVEYSNDPTTGGKGESVPDIVRVYTYKFGIDKYTIKNGSTEHTQLAGAQFQLKVKGGKDAIKFVRTNDGDAENNTNKISVYRVAKTADEANATETIVTPKSGRVDLTGLAKGAYVLTETKAPQGYNLPAHSFAVNVDGTEPTDGTNASTTIKYTNNSDDENATQSEATDGIIGIENTSGPTLPSTGGMGTALFTVFGVLIVALGSAWYVKSNRKSTK